CCPENAVQDLSQPAFLINNLAADHGQLPGGIVPDFAPFVQHPFNGPQQGVVQGYHPQQLKQLGVFFLKLIEKIHASLQRDQGQLDFMEFILVKEGAFHPGLVQVREYIEKIRGGESLSGKNDPSEFVSLVKELVDQAEVFAKANLVYKIRPQGTAAFLPY